MYLFRGGNPSYEKTYFNAEHQPFDLEIWDIDKNTPPSSHTQSPGIPERSFTILFRSLYQGVGGRSADHLPRGSHRHYFGLSFVSPESSVLRERS
jgi:hypothetical protein